jgi:predicted secreted protein
MKPVPTEAERAAFTSTPLWRDRYYELLEEHQALIDSLPERDRSVAQAGYNAAASRYAQAGADAAVKALAERGLLRQKPARSEPPAA